MIKIPTAEALDTQGEDTDVDMYLIPAAESDCETPKIVALLSEPGSTPEPAYRNRWLHLGTLPPHMAGSSIHAAIQARAAFLGALAASYQGDGRWAIDPDGDFWFNLLWEIRP